MSLIELILIAIGLSMDAFAVAVCSGLSMEKAGLKKAVIVGLYFGVFQALMPLIGYALGYRFTYLIESFDHWIAFALLTLIGAKMIRESLSGQDCEKPAEASLRPSKMLPLALATSIDALAVGVLFAFQSVDIAPAAALIGIITMLLSMAGVKIGNIFGLKFKARAEMAGGIILILIGLKILLEHLEIINF